jgi:hypothetical protein
MVNLEVTSKAPNQPPRGHSQRNRQARQIQSYEKNQRNRTGTVDSPCIPMRHRAATINMSARHDQHELLYGQFQVWQTARNIQQCPVLNTFLAWVRSAEEDDLVPEPPSDYFLPNSPQSAFVAQHNHSPWAKAKKPTQRPENSEDGGGLLSRQVHAVRKSRWISFAEPSAYPSEHWEGEKVDPQWLNQHLTDYSKPWLADHNEDDIEDGSGRYHAFRRKRKTWYKRMQQTILRNPMIPLVFRMTVFTFSAVALALGAAIHREAQMFDFSQGASALLAIIVDAVALVYILYITYDEYTGKPLGLRPAKAKLKVILLDLFFIVFQSANLSLAYQTLSDPDEACTPGDSGQLSDATDAGVCSKQKALASVLLIALIAWLNTFCVSILR